MDQREELWLINQEFWAVTLGQTFPRRLTPVSSQMKSTGSFNSNPVIPCISTSIVLISQVRVFVGPSEDSQTQLEWHWGLEEQTTSSSHTRDDTEGEIQKCCHSLSTDLS